MTRFILERDTFRRVEVFIKRKAQKANMGGACMEPQLLGDEVGEREFHAGLNCRTRLGSKSEKRW